MPFQCLLELCHFKELLQRGGETKIRRREIPPGRKSQVFVVQTLVVRLVYIKPGLGARCVVDDGRVLSEFGELFLAHVQRGSRKVGISRREVPPVRKKEHLPPENSIQDALVVPPYKSRVFFRI